METINKITETATNAIWGSNDKPAESGTEPVSGQQGTGTATEPYDAGNTNADDMSRSGAENRNAVGTNNDMNIDQSRKEDVVSESLPAAAPSNSESQYFGTLQSNASNTDEGLGNSSERRENDYSNISSSEPHTIRREAQDLTTGGGTTGINTADDSGNIQSNTSNADDGLGTSSEHRENDYSNISSSDPNTISREAQGLTTGGGTTGINTAGDRDPPSSDTLSTGANPLHSGAPHFTVERPTEADQPQSGTHAGGFGTAEPSVSAAPDSGASFQQKHQGSDRPAEAPHGDEVAEEAVRRKTQMAEEALAGGSGDTDLPRHDASGGSANEGLGKPGPEIESKSEEKGTGMKYVRSTGMAADGGDFDATRPGAGREADRLLEEQGVNRDHTDTSRTSIAAAAHASGEGKRSVADKVKDKLHMGSH